MHPGSLVKNTLGLNRSLPNDFASSMALAILKKPDKDREKYARSIISLTRFNGVDSIDGRKIILRWSYWLWSTEKIEKYIARIKSQIPEKKIKEPKTKIKSRPNLIPSSSNDTIKKDTRKQTKTQYKVKIPKTQSSPEKTAKKPRIEKKKDKSKHKDLKRVKPTKNPLSTLQTKKSSKYSCTSKIDRISEKAD